MTLEMPFSFIEKALLFLSVALSWSAVLRDQGELLVSRVEASSLGAHLDSDFFFDFLDLDFVPFIDCCDSGTARLPMVEIRAFRVDILLVAELPSIGITSASSLLTKAAKEVFDFSDKVARSLGDRWSKDSFLMLCADE